MLMKSQFKIFQVHHLNFKKIFNVETIDVPDDVSDEDGDALSYSLTGEDASAFVIEGNLVRFNGSRL